MLYLYTVIHPRIKALTTYLINPYNTPRRHVDGKMIPLVTDGEPEAQDPEGTCQGPHQVSE